MISYIKGKIIKNNLSNIEVLTNAGVGYKVFVVPNDNFKEGEEIEITTHLVVKEDALDLYGFENDDQKELFILSLGVSGIGPKSALQILNLGSTEDIKNAIASGDAEYLSKVNGIGKKTAERLVLELKNKVSSLGKVSDYGGQISNSLGDVVEALIAMGYKPQQARDAVKGLDKDKKSEELIREALKQVK